MRTLLSILPFICFVSHAQSWALQRCIDTALVKNYDLQNTQIDLLLFDIEIKTAKQSRLPTLNSAASHGYNWGQTIDPFTNEFATNRVQYNNFYLNSSVVLFSGFENYYEIKAKELNFQAAQYNQLIEQRNLKMEIVASYLQILLNQEILELAREHLRLTQQQKKDRQLYIDANQKTKNSILEIEAQEAQGRYLIVQAENDLNYSLLLLQQLMGLTYDSTFNIQDQTEDTQHLITEKTFSPDNLPELQLLNLQVEKQSLEIQSAKGLLYPSLNLNGSLGSGYSENSKYLSSNGTLLPKPFGNQIRENLYQSVSLSLNIPIFNGNITRSQLQIKNLELMQLKLNQQQQTLNVQQKAQQLELDIVNAKSQQEAGIIALKLAEKQFEHARLQYENGTINFTTLSAVKNNLFKASSQVIQVKYKLSLKKFVKEIYFQEETPLQFPD